MTKRKRFVWLGLIFMCLTVLVACQTEDESSLEAEQAEEVAESEGEETPTGDEAAASETRINMDVAITLAQAHLNSMDLGDARFAYAYLTTEDGVEVWRVEFEYDGTSYEFYIHTQTGEFLLAPGEGGATTNGGATESVTVIPPGASPGNPPANWPDDAVISYEAAVEIAQGLVQGQLIEVDHDFENGIAVWHVELNVNGVTHDIYVDIMSGEIVDHEYEIDD